MLDIISSEHVNNGPLLPTLTSRYNSCAPCGRLSLDLTARGDWKVSRGSNSGDATAYQRCSSGWSIVTSGLVEADMLRCQSPMDQDKFYPNQGSNDEKDEAVLRRERIGP
jgi:hypothetical protein